MAIAILFGSPLQSPYQNESEIQQIEIGLFLLRRISQIDIV